MSRVCLLSLLAAVSVVAACATNVHEPAVTDRAAASDAASASGSTRATATASATAAVTVDGTTRSAETSASDSAAVVDLSAQVTRTEVVVPTADEGDRLVCQRVTQVGTHMARRVCYTESELARQREETQQMLREGGARGLTDREIAIQNSESRLSF
jgi:hypothetical protein